MTNYLTLDIIEKSKIRIFLFLYMFIYLLQALGKFVPLETYGLYLIIHFIFVFTTFLLLHFMKARNSYNRVFIVASAWMLLSLSLGFINSWEVRDIFGDSGRFIAPFLAFSLGLVLLKNASDKDLEIVIKGILRFLIFVGLLNFLSRLVELFVFKEPLIKYASGGVDIEIFLFGFCLLYLANSRRISIANLLFFGLFIVLFISEPILSMSKSKFLVMVAIFIIYFLFYAGIRTKIILALLICFFVYILIEINTNLGLIMRLEQAIVLVLTFDAGNKITDFSTFTRIAELQGAFRGIAESFYFPFTYILGLGSGAVWFLPGVDLGTGLDVGNYRVNGGVHHIHIEIGSLLFRHGFVGLMIYLLFVGSILRSSLKLSFKAMKKNNFIYAALGSVAFCCVGAFTFMLTDTSVYGNFTFGLLAVLTQKSLYNLRKSEAG